MDKDTIPCPLDFPFTCSEIKKGIRKNKKIGKKEGPDWILNEFTKTGSQTMTLIVVNVHQYGTAHLYILFINLGIQMICNNYRGIIVTSCWGKLFTPLLQKRLGRFFRI